MTPIPMTQKSEISEDILQLIKKRKTKKINKEKKESSVNDGSSNRINSALDDDSKSMQS
jgi:hypothetical protein